MVSFITSAWTWIQTNWPQIVEAYLLLIGAASIIVKLTPWVSDDDALKWLLKFTGKYIALNKSKPDA